MTQSELIDAINNLPEQVFKGNGYETRYSVDAFRVDDGTIQVSIVHDNEWPSDFPGGLGIKHAFDSNVDPESVLIDSDAFPLLKAEGYGAYEVNEADSWVTYKR